ncbi:MULTISPECIES: hypothetical protein [unclassified Microcoleus]|uniref:hypothetical protein n=2 Tax=unclassified Microcoleus TaxID=2642155 RepID=UPI002FD4375D
MKENVWKSEAFYMEPSQSQSPQIITIYKAPQKRKGQKLLKEGFQPVDFPYNPPYVDGNCYFAGPNDRSIAEEYNQCYKEGILEVSIDKSSYEQYFKSLEYRYDEKDGYERIEVIVPQRLFAILNQFPRVLKPH